LSSVRLVTPHGARRAPRPSRRTLIGVQT
jgi:hypothetical protein